MWKNPCLQGLLAYCTYQVLKPWVKEGLRDGDVRALHTSCGWRENFAIVNRVRKPVIHRYVTVLCLLLEVDPLQESESGWISSLEAR